MKEYASHVLLPCHKISMQSLFTMAYSFIETYLQRFWKAHLNYFAHLSIVSSFSFRVPLSFITIRSISIFGELVIPSIKYIYHAIIIGFLQYVLCSHLRKFWAQNRKTVIRVREACANVTFLLDSLLEEVRDDITRLGTYIAPFLNRSWFIKKNTQLKLILPPSSTNLDL